MKTNNNSIKLKVASDLFFTQMVWSMWYIPIVFVVYLIVNNLIPHLEIGDMNLTSVIFNPSKIFMFIIGIVTCFEFLTHYVKNGITRKDYFAGSAMAAVGVASSIIIISVILNGVLQILGLSTSIPVIHLNTAFTWILPMVLSLTILCYYLAGWVIAVAWYRFGGKGAGFIPIALIIVSFIDLIWLGEIYGPLSFLNISFPEIPILFSMIITLIIITLTLWMIRLVTKEVPIKLE